MSSLRFAAAALVAGLSLTACSNQGNNTKGVEVQATKILAKGTIKCPGPDVVIPFVADEGSSHIDVKVVADAKTTISAIAEISTPANWTNMHPNRPDKLYVDFRKFDVAKCEAGATIAGTPCPNSPNTPYYATMQSELTAGRYVAYVLQPWFWDEPTPTRLHLSCNGDSAAP